LPSFGHFDEPCFLNIIGCVLHEAQALGCVPSITVNFGGHSEARFSDTGKHNVGTRLAVPHARVVELVNQGARSGSAMQDAETYRQYADDCMKLAKTMPAYRKQLADMAATWQRLAEAAEKRDEQKPAPET
jgi:hypothetical protein